MANLTTKGLSGIEDQLKAEQTMICKLNHFASLSQDAALRAKLGDMANKHQQHYNRLYSLLG